MAAPDSSTDDRAPVPPPPTGPRPPRADYLTAIVGFGIGAVLILCCAFTLPRLPAAVDVIGPWTVWGGFTIVTVVAGVLFWSNLQKLYGLLTQ